MRTIALLLLAALAGIGGFMLYQTFAPQEDRLVGQAAFDMRLQDTDGNIHRLVELRGKWVLLNFWASWCAPCMDELPLLVDAQKRYGPKGFQILGPALDTPESVAPVIQRFGINYPVSADFAGADTAMQAFGNDKAALPYSVLIGPDGNVAETMLGAFTAQELDSMLRTHLRIRNTDE